MILVDTSVWIGHFRAKDAALASLLESGCVLMHPFVLGELACGNLQNRRVVLHLLSELPMAPAATESEVLKFIEHRGLMGRGIGYIDVHLLASAALDGRARIWSHDKRLAAVAAELKLAYTRKG